MSNPPVTLTLLGAGPFTGSVSFTADVVGSGSGAPTNVAFTSPASPVSATAGVGMAFTGTATGADAVRLHRNGADVAAAAYSNGIVSGTWVPPQATDGTQQSLTLVATNAHGSTESAPLIVNVGTPSSGSYSPIVTAFGSAVQTRRGAALPTAALDAYEDLWQRLGNRDSELTTSRQNNLVELFVHRSGYNVGAGSELVGLLGTVAPFAGTKTPVWNANSISYPGGDAYAEVADGLMTGLAGYAIVVIGQPYGPTITTTRHVVKQALPTSTPGNITLYQSASSADTPGITFGRPSGVNISSNGPPGILAARALYASGHFGDTITTRDLIAGSTNVGTSTVNIAGTNVPEAPFQMGGIGGGTDDSGGFNLSLVAVFNVWNTADLVAIGTILRQTVAAGLFP